MTEKIRAHIFVSGRVHGVFFRAETQEKANSTILKLDINENLYPRDLKKDNRRIFRNFKKLSN